DETVAMLLAVGSPPDSPDDPYQQTPLMKASGYGHTRVVDLLLAADADANRFDHTGDTALHNAARYGHAEVVKSLLAAGANPNVIGSILIETPLHEASLRNHPEVVGQLLAAGAAVEAQTK